MLLDDEDHVAKVQRVNVQEGEDRFNLAILHLDERDSAVVDHLVLASCVEFLYEFPMVFSYNLRHYLVDLHAKHFF